MTYLSKPQAFLTDKAKELVGRTIVCQRDAGAGYFTKGKEYEIHMDTTECPYIFNDFGGYCHQSASTFVLKQLPLTPKQPKVGEVWMYKTTSIYADNPYHPRNLYYITEIVDGKVYHRRAGSEANIEAYTDTVEDFINQHVFVF